MGIVVRYLGEIGWLICSCWIEGCSRSGIDALGSGMLIIPGDKASTLARGVARNPVDNLAFGLDGSARLPSGRGRPDVDQRVVDTAGFQHLNDRVRDLFHRGREIRVAQAEGVLNSPLRIGLLESIEELLQAKSTICLVDIAISGGDRIYLANGHVVPISVRRLNRGGVHANLVLSC